MIKVYIPFMESIYIGNSSPSGGLVCMYCGRIRHTRGYLIGVRPQSHVGPDMYKQLKATSISAVLCKLPLATQSFAGKEKDKNR